MQRKLEEDSHSRGTIDKSCPSMIDCGWLGIGKRPDFLLTKWCLAIAIKQPSKQATKQRTPNRSIVLDFATDDRAARQFFSPDQKKCTSRAGTSHPWQEVTIYVGLLLPVISSDAPAKAPLVVR